MKYVSLSRIRVLSVDLVHDLDRCSSMIAWTSGIAQFTVRTPQNSQKRNNNNTKLLQQIKFKIEKKGLPLFGIHKYLEEKIFAEFHSFIHHMTLACQFECRSTILFGHHKEDTWMGCYSNIVMA